MALIADVRKTTASGTKHCLSLDVAESIDSDLRPEFRIELRNADNTVLRTRVLAEEGDTPLSVMIKAFESLSKVYHKPSEKAVPSKVKVRKFV